MGAAVTAAIPPWFLGQMQRMLGLKFAPAVMTSHWEGLRDVPVDLLSAAVSEALRESDEFPSPKALRSYSELVQARTAARTPDEDRGEDLADQVLIGTLPNGCPIYQTRTWRYYCDDCVDSGWNTFWCAGTDPLKPWLMTWRCDRSQSEHGPHEWVRECGCVLTNPAVQKRRAQSCRVKVEK